MTKLYDRPCKFLEEFRNWRNSRCRLLKVIVLSEISAVTKYGWAIPTKHYNSKLDTGLVKFSIFAMDLASLISAQVSKSKPSTTTNASQKYLRKADLEAQRQEEYKREQEALRKDRDTRAAQKRKFEDDEAERKQEREEKRNKLAEESKRRREEEEAKEEKARRKRLGLPDLPPKPSEDESSTPIPEDEDIPDETLISKLRTLKEPVTLFGETHVSRLKRYKHLTNKAFTKSSKAPIPTHLQTVPEAEMLVPLVAPTAPVDRTYLYRQLTSYFNLLFTEWSITLAGRDTATKTSTTGIAASNTLTQTIASLRPLFQKFEKDDLDPSILSPLLEIVRAMQERKYVDANDGYLRLSIGKAAWPIGVTMVGIHERSAREKLHEDGKGKAAHIMADESTRKFLQGIKRCLSFAQTRWPPEDFGQLMG